MTRDGATRVHATAVALNGRAALIIGVAGSGKSDLALRLLDRGWDLIADDAVDLAASHGRLVAMAPAGANGRIAVRGIGITTAQMAIPSAALSIVVTMTYHPLADTLVCPDRYGPVCGLFLPQVALFPFEPSAVIKLSLAMARWGL